MARPKKTSTDLINAEKREAGLRTILDLPTFSNDASLEGYSQLIQDLRTKLSAYHSSLTTADDLARDVKATEQLLRKYSEKMLLNVAAHYGKDSREYGQAGGVPTGERKKKRTRLPAPKQLTPVPTQPTLLESLPAIDLNASIHEEQPKTVGINGNGNGKVLAV
jgi:hypothetical protein